MYIADLHIHSRFSRATSREGDLPHLDWWARRKGIGLVGTGDFTHPAWRAELREQLVPAGEGLYTLREDLRLPQEAPGPAPYFVVTGEIAASISVTERPERYITCFFCPPWRRRMSSRPGWRPLATSAPTGVPSWGWTAGTCWS